MKPKRWHTRTIHSGQVKILGRTYEPSQAWLTYDGRLDGMRYVFALYFTGDMVLPYVCCWGSEEQYRSAENLASDKMLVDGYYPWAVWYERGSDEHSRDSSRAHQLSP